MSQPYIGQILAFAGGFAPLGYAKCEGQIMEISQYDILYRLLGTKFGGDGVTTFALPDLRGRVPIHKGQGKDLSDYVIGQTAGLETVTLTTDAMPQHSHPVNVVTGGSGGNAFNPSGNFYLADEYEKPAKGAFTYAPAGNPQVPLADNSISQTGPTGSHPNIQPYLAVQYCIALEGLFPRSGES